MQMNLVRGSLRQPKGASFVVLRCWVVFVLLLGVFLGGLLFLRRNALISLGVFVVFLVDLFVVFCGGFSTPVNIYPAKY